MKKGNFPLDNSCIHCFWKIENSSFRTHGLFHTHTNNINQRLSLQPRRTVKYFNFHLNVLFKYKRSNIHRNWSFLNRSEICNLIPKVLLSLFSTLRMKCQIRHQCDRTCCIINFRIFFIFVNDIYSVLYVPYYYEMFAGFVYTYLLVMRSFNVAVCLTVCFIGVNIRHHPFLRE